ncbi:hypothetical protein BMETH_1180_1 [methanotrophic bacterial endosymbiont of Bathymodiolus sp.]|nr:hypothetical protein BMETH_1180_1 [methanotrophic bacterial endosymbiont of Bathymodiolus sp.]
MLFLISKMIFHIFDRTQLLYPLNNQYLDHNLLYGLESIV